MNPPDSAAPAAATPPDNSGSRAPMPPPPASAPETAPADVVWKPYPSPDGVAPEVALYGHTMLMRAFLTGWIRVLDADKNVLAVLKGKGTQRLAQMQFQSPDPDPGQPHFATIEVSEGAELGGYQIFRADHA